MIKKTKLKNGFFQTFRCKIVFIIMLRLNESVNLPPARPLNTLELLCAGEEWCSPILDAVE